MKERLNEMTPARSVGRRRFVRKPFYFYFVLSSQFELSSLKRKEPFVLLALEVNLLVVWEIIPRKGADTTPSELWLSPLSSFGYIGLVMVMLVTDILKK